MTREMGDSVENAPLSRAGVGVARTLDSVGWGLFFAWVGFALLMDLSWGIGLLGVGAITLGGQAARWYFGLALEGFWVAVGVLFTLGGIWESLGIEVSLVPIVLILVGAVLLLSALRRG